MKRLRGEAYCNDTSVGCKIEWRCVAHTSASESMSFCDGIQLVQYLPSAAQVIQMVLSSDNGGFCRGRVPSPALSATRY